MNNEHQPKNIAREQFETSDFYLACFLRCIGYELGGARRAGQRVTFMFADKPERPNDLIAFFSDRVVVKPLRFVSAIKDLKALLHST